MLTLYWILLIISGTYFLTSLMGFDADGTDLGELDTDLNLDGEADDTDGPKLFSLKVLAGAVLGFSIGGMALSYGDHGLTYQLIGGLGTAILFGVLAFYLSKWAYGFQGNSNFSMETLPGLQGTISISSAEAGGEAQVKLYTSDGPREYTCYPSDARVKLKLNDRVEVESQIGTGLLVSRIKNNK